jgi:hypothetical protein
MKYITFFHRHHHVVFPLRKRLFDLLKQRGESTFVKRLIDSRKNDCPRPGFRCLVYQSFVYRC